MKQKGSTLQARASLRINALARVHCALYSVTLSSLTMARCGTSWVLDLAGRFCEAIR